MVKERLNLKKALKTGRLSDFISDQEKSYPDGADRKTFAKVVKAAIKPQQSERQTSRSQAGDSSPGKRTR
jgi:hypothetical protein